jgi:aspartate-semialdehyde dehydrogenase
LAKASEQQVALVGGDTLLAREIREALEANKPALRVQLISAATDATVLSPQDEETVVMIPLAPESLEGSAVAFLAGSAASSRRALKLNPQGGPALIDLTGSLEDQPEARLRAPSAEVPEPSNKTSIQIIAHPAAIAITMLLTRLSSLAKVRSAIIHVFDPASERGQRGIEELRKQTVNVLSFKKLDTDVFDTQLAFNLLARYGEEALEPLEEIEHRIERHTASLLSRWPNLPMPSIRLIQAPVFHGHSFSVWVDLDSEVDAKMIADTLASHDVDVRSDESPSNAHIAGQSGLSVGAIHADSNNPRAVWIWMVADNLRLAAENAVTVAKEWL